MKGVVRQEAPLNHGILASKMNHWKGLLRGLFPDKEGARRNGQSQGNKEGFKNNYPSRQTHTNSIQLV